MCAKPENSFPFPIILSPPLGSQWALIWEKVFLVSHPRQNGIYQDNHTNMPWQHFLSTSILGYGACVGIEGRAARWLEKWDKGTMLTEAILQSRKSWGKVQTSHIRDEGVEDFWVRFWYDENNIYKRRLGYGDLDWLDNRQETQELVCGFRNEVRAWPRVRAEGKETLGKKNFVEENKVKETDGIRRSV